MAITAAAAVVGPTVLMAAPAMADEAKPAVTTPDAAPAADAAAAPAAETPAAKPAAETPAKPAAETPAKPAAETPAKPAAETPAKPETKPTAGTDEDDVVATGPVLGINGVPSTIKAGDWTNLTVSVDNKGKTQESYVLILAVADQNEKLTAEKVRVQVFSQGAWHDVEVAGDQGAPVALLTEDIKLPAGKTTLQVRVKFAASAPTGNIAIAVAGGSNVDEDVWSETAWAESKLVSGSTGGNTGGNTGGDHTGGNTGNNGGHNNGGGNDTKPNGGGTTTPIVDHNTGNTGNTNTGGQLAETGADAATSWALGAGGVALAMGAALVAGTGKRRRVQA